MKSGTLDTAKVVALRERYVGRQLDLAILVGVTSMTVTRWESGTLQPNPVHFQKLCSVLLVDPDELLISNKVASQ